MIPKLVPAGYLIVEVAQDASTRSPMIPHYHGVDRLPPFIAADDSIRVALDAPMVSDSNLRKCLDEWFDLKAAPTPFISDLRTAARLVKCLEDAGVRLELLYCEVAIGDVEPSRKGQYPFQAIESPLNTTVLGYDVSWPSCKHSAIRQPPIVPESPGWQSRLNAWGLLDDFTLAARLKAEYLSVYPYPPFDIFRVHQISKDG
jgi:hypothetical protein